jgi:hypothetical protein
MQLALRPYVTTGIAIVGASVIAVAPIAPTPPDIQIPNPVTVVDRGVQLTAGQIENAFNQVAFVGAQVLVRLATLPAPVVAPLLGISTAEAQAFLALGAVGLFGSLISGTGATGTGLQEIVDALGRGDFAGFINAEIGFPATLIDGIVNGGYGPNLSPLLAEAIAGVLSEALGVPIPPAAIGTVLAGGLINPFTPLSLSPPIGVVVSGLFPTLQGLVERLLEPLGGGSMMAAASTLALPVESEGPIEGAVNTVLFNLVARPIVAVSGLVGSLLAPLIGEEAAALLPVAALGLFGPLISGPGAVGTAIQDVVDSLGSGDFAGVVNNLIGAQATIIGGFINGGSGPSLTPLVGPILFPGVPTNLLPKFTAGGLINSFDIFNPTVLPGTIPTVQQLVSQFFGLLPGAPALTAAAPVEELSINSVDNVDTSDKKLVTLNVVPDGNDGSENGGDDAAGKHVVPDSPPGGATADLTANLSSQEKVPDKVKDIKAAIEGDKGPQTGKDVSNAAKLDAAPGKPGTDTETLDTSDGNKAIPDSTGSDDNGNGNKKKKGGSNPVGSAISSTAKGFAGAVRGALGG